MAELHFASGWNRLSEFIFEVFLAFRLISQALFDSTHRPLEAGEGHSHIALEITSVGYFELRLAMDAGVGAAGSCARPGRR